MTGGSDMGFRERRFGADDFMARRELRTGKERFVTDELLAITFPFWDRPDDCQVYTKTITQLEDAAIQASLDTLPVPDYIKMILGITNYHRFIVGLGKHSCDRFER